MKLVYKDVIKINETFATTSFQFSKIALDTYAYFSSNRQPKTDFLNLWSNANLRSRGSLLLLSQPGNKDRKGTKAVVQMILLGLYSNEGAGEFQIPYSRSASSVWSKWNKTYVHLLSSPAPYILIAVFLLTTDCKVMQTIEYMSCFAKSEFFIGSLYLFISEHSWARPSLLQYHQHVTKLFT